MYAKEIYIKNQLFEYYDNLIKQKKIETKIVDDQLKYLMLDDYVLEKKLDRIKK